MPDLRSFPGWARLAAVGLLSTLTLGVALGRSGRLTYHEAFVAQSAREMLANGGMMGVIIPTLGGRPWLEKPPLAIWLVALAGRVTGSVGEAEARLPSALAGMLLALGVSAFAAKRYGPAVGLLAGLVQATTAWTVLRGRLAEADMVLACLVTWTLIAFDRIRAADEPRLNAWRWAFFAGLGLTSLAKGIGFGAVLVLAVVAITLLWDRDRETLRRLRFPKGWALSASLALAWPLVVVLRHPSALGLWVLHVSDRLAENPEQFTGSRPWWYYSLPVLGQLLPWTPLALAGAFRSVPRAFGRDGRAGADRFLWAWAVAPVVLLSLATVKSAHYAIHALPPWSVWSALGLIRLGERLQASRGWPAASVRRAAWATFAGLGLAYAVGHAAIAPWADRHGRGVEWAFYEDAGRALAPGEPVVLLYNVPDWDRKPYVTPFGPVPHDWGVRLFYLDHPAPCRFGVDELAATPPEPSPLGFAVLGRESDLPGLRRLGRVETLAEGPTLRAAGSKVDDRTYRLYRVRPDAAVASRPDAVGTRTR